MTGKTLFGALFLACMFWRPAGAAQPSFWAQLSDGGRITVFGSNDTESVFDCRLTVQFESEDGRVAKLACAFEVAAGAIDALVCSRPMGESRAVAIGAIERVCRAR